MGGFSVALWGGFDSLGGFSGPLWAGFDPLGDFGRSVVSALVGELLGVNRFCLVAFSSLLGAVFASLAIFCGPTGAVVSALFGVLASVTEFVCFG